MSKLQKQFLKEWEEYKKEIQKKNKENSADIILRKFISPELGCVFYKRNLYKATIEGFMDYLSEKK